MIDKYLIPHFKKSKVNLNMKLPGSKSLTNRAMIISALASGKTKLRNILISDDTIYMYKVLSALGIRIRMNEADNNCEIQGGKLPAGNHELFVGNAGTAMRFLTSYLSLGNGEFLLDGDDRMRERPIEDLLKALKQLGCDVSAIKGNGCPPVRIIAGGMPGGDCVISGKNSSQYISSILMSAPYSKNGVTINTLGEISSKPYIDMTVGIMGIFGASISGGLYDKIKVSTSEYKCLKRYEIEPDASSASYFLAAAAILSGSVVIKGLDNNSIQGDVYFINVLKKMGCNVQVGTGFIKLESDGKLSGLQIDMNECPDLVPTLAIVALFADSPTLIKNVANLRIKESDRIKAISTELKKMGAEVVEFNDGLEIFPREIYNDAVIETYNDHRIAMAFSIAGLKIPGIEIINPNCVSKSFPNFYDYLNKYFTY